jgi:uncharacterized protein (DUF433 family)
MIDWRERVEINPDIMLGKPVIAGTRIPVEQILRKLAADMSTDDVLREYPGLTRQDVQAALAYASDALGSEEILPAGKPR